MGDFDEVEEIQVFEENGELYDMNGARLFTRDEVERIMKGVYWDASEGFNIDGMSPEDYI